MGYIQWLIVVMSIAIGFYGGYCLLIITHTKEGKGATVWLAGFLFYPEYLDEVGKTYRRKMIICWVVGLALAVIAVQIG